MARPKLGPAGRLPGPGASLKHDMAQHLPAGPELGVKYGPSHCEHMSHLLKKLLTYYIIIVNLLFRKICRFAYSHAHVM